MGLVKCKCGRNTSYGLTCVFCQDLIADLDFEKKEPELEEPGFLKELEFKEVFKEDATNTFDEEGSDYDS